MHAKLSQFELASLLFVEADLHIESRERKVLCCVCHERTGLRVGKQDLGVRFVAEAVACALHEVAFRGKAI